MPRPSSLALAKTQITGVLTDSAQKVYSESELSALLDEHARAWRLARTTSKNDFIAFLKQHGLDNHKFRSSDYGREITRYVWGKPSRLELALAINRRGYLSHGTAAKLHGLSKRDQPTIYVNIEQSPKPPPSGRMTQDSLDLAFSRQQRTSNLIYEVDDFSVTIIAGKNTKQLGVVDMLGAGGTLRVTDLERTLIDVVVRPAYAGGPSSVLRAYRTALGRIDAEKLVATLKRLDYAYPYHQTIGFLMSRAGYPALDRSVLAGLPIRQDFYFAHGMEEPKYDMQWRLYYPKDLRV
jgi:AbiEi antitoxin C-terminal domain